LRDLPRLAGSALAPPSEAEAHEIIATPRAVQSRRFAAEFDETLQVSALKRLGTRLAEWSLL
jgi:hypothetical protein